MKIKHKLAFIIALIMITSCTSLSNKDVKDNKASIEFINSSDLVGLSLLLQDRPEALIDIIKPKNFKVKNLDYMYKDEEMILNQEINANLMLTKAVAKNPTMTIKKAMKTTINMKIMINILLLKMKQKIQKQ